MYLSGSQSTVGKDQYIVYFALETLQKWARWYLTGEPASSPFLLLRFRVSSLQLFLPFLSLVYCLFEISTKFKGYRKEVDWERGKKKEKKLRKSEIIQLWRRRKREGYVTNCVCVRKSQFSFALTNMYDLHTKNKWTGTGTIDLIHDTRHLCMR